MIKPNFNEAPKWAKLWLWSPHYANDKGYWATLPDKDGVLSICSAAIVSSLKRPSRVSLGVWKRSQEADGVVIRINVSLENK